ncbi:terminase small subunit [Variovorax sp.]|jgi:phage terminase small subunit|uniref:terminase small subunit n=1 Tax=Variovorax sp. TaxID=1871043 RepID=UPI0025FEAEAA|nr:terminase small subunit [Variovorax sp.]
MAPRKPAKKQAAASKKITTEPAARKKAAGSPARKKAPATKAKKQRRPAAPESAQLGLTGLQQRFVDKYLIDLKDTRAASAPATYSPDSARQMAFENLSKPYIQGAIADARRRSRSAPRWVPTVW